ncbi:C-type lectin lectoxin-Phi1-like [Syngnathus typhle]
MYLHLLMAFFAIFLPAPVMSATELQCDVKNWWEPFWKHCYLIPRDKLTWWDAEEYCVSQKAQLSSVRSEDEMDFLTKLVTKAGVWSAFLGLRITWKRAFWGNYFPEFYNSDNATPDYFRWNEGEPNNHRGREFCVEVRTDGYLNDWRCDRPQGFICKKAKDVPTPPLTCPICPPPTKCPTPTICAPPKCPTPTICKCALKMWHDLSLTDVRLM